MVGGMLRHLGSLRRMKRDNGWIETLLEESYNERMHLLTFMKMGEPGWFMKLMILGAQGVVFNGMFLAYLVSPRICHRFVGYLEEEAVHTYTRCLREIEMGQLPKWSDPKFEIPELAVQYWRIPEGKRTMKDLILYIRADGKQQTHHPTWEESRLYDRIADSTPLQRPSIAASTTPSATSTRTRIPIPSSANTRMATAPPRRPSSPPALSGSTSSEGAKLSGISRAAATTHDFFLPLDFLCKRFVHLGISLVQRRGG